MRSDDDIVVLSNFESIIIVMQVRALLDSIVISIIRDLFFVLSPIESIVKRCLVVATTTTTTTDVLTILKIRRVRAVLASSWSH